MTDHIKQSNQYLIKRLTEDVLEMKVEIKTLKEMMIVLLHKTSPTCNAEQKITIEKNKKIPTDEEISKGWFW